MIINGEKVPAFSATTLSIPDTPKDNFDAIIAHSREYYARPRMEVEAEIRETIEQSEKYKKDLSDSGRQEEPKLVISTKEQPVFRPISTPNNSPAQRSTSISRSNTAAEQKPNLKRPAARPTSPQEDFRRQKLSPNAAEGKERMGLKDLAKLVLENRETNGEVKPGENAATTDSDKKGKPVKNRNRSGKKGKRKPGKSEKKTLEQQPKSTPVSTPVKPEVEYQEKSAVDIHPSHNSLSLSTPVKRTEDFAGKDNSVDGFLSIKH